MCRVCEVGEGSDWRMRIAFAGASGTGKSTLAKFVAERYGLEQCPVGSRSVAVAMGFASPYDVDAAGKRAEFQRRLFVEKRAWEEAHESFVTDRTHLDNLAYATMHGCAESLTKEDLRAYSLAMGRYTNVFLCPVAAFQDLAGDPQRVASEAYHRLYDLVLSALFDALHRGPASRFECGGREEREVLLGFLLGETSPGAKTTAP